MDKLARYACIYKVEYVDCDGRTKTEGGLLYAESFTHAAYIIDNDIYGDDLVKILYIELFETTFTFNNDDFEKILHMIREKGGLI